MTSSSTARPQDVGILAAEVYFPRSFVTQEDLEVANGVSQGKYTIGLGQKSMAFTGDREDVNSMALTAVAGLLEKYGLDPKDVGRLEVGTETLVDKSKSTKTVVMDLFAGNTDVEGATITNACYGGTAALLNAVAWVESSGWDGRYAIVVAVDIAVYAAGPARPTGGAGAVAVLIGPDAPIVVDMSLRATHASNVWDFFKPHLDSEYPQVDGYLSQTCYYQALDDCYTRLGPKLDAAGRPFVAQDCDLFVFHSPYHKLVQKSFARLMLHDAKRLCEAGQPLPPHLEGLLPWVDKPLEETYVDRELEAAGKKSAKSDFEERVQPSLNLSQRIGNTYTASVFMNLVCLVCSRAADLPGKRALVFSYGSGALATMYQVRFRELDGPFSLSQIAVAVRLEERLEARKQEPVAALEAALESRSKAHSRDAAPPPTVPSYPVDELFPGTYYLEGVCQGFTRSYGRVPPSSEVVLPTHQRSRTWKTKQDPNQAVVVTGVACGLPGQESVFCEDNLQRLLRGQSCVAPLPATTKSALLEKNVVTQKKSANGGPPSRMRISDPSDTIQLAARLGNTDLSRYGVSHSIAATMDRAVQVAVVAGLEALKDAGLVSGKAGPLGWKLAEELQDGTGVVYATSFPALDAAIGEVMRFLRSRCVTRAKRGKLLAALRKRLQQASPNGTVSKEDEEALLSLEKAVVTKSTINLAALLDQERVREGSSAAAFPSESCANNGAGNGLANGNGAPESHLEEPGEYEFDRKFLFRVLVLGNAQLAQIVGARGPNMQTNAACAGSTQAVAMAQDMMAVGRCERVIVIAGDDASGEVLMPWIGNGFRALGAASIANRPEDAALPFDARRNGMLLGSGAIGMVLETEAAYARRCGMAVGLLPLPAAGGEEHPHLKGAKARLLETLMSNSAYHGASMDRHHIAREMERFLQAVQEKHGVSREDIAKQGVYFSHETCTHANPQASCAFNEVHALRECFGDLLEDLIIINTKGFTGHPMGVSFEDVAAVEVLSRGVLPPTANYREQDPHLGKLRLSSGGNFKAKYAMRFAAGFGSQVVLALYAAL
jgi:3-hydroxy-3-methylglutaryl-CoA-synthase